MQIQNQTIIDLIELVDHKYNINEISIYRNKLMDDIVFIKIPHNKLFMIHSENLKFNHILTYGLSSITFNNFKKHPIIIHKDIYKYTGEINENILHGILSANNKLNVEDNNIIMFKSENGNAGLGIYHDNENRFIPIYYLTYNKQKEIYTLNKMKKYNRNRQYYGRYDYEFNEWRAIM